MNSDLSSKIVDQYSSILSPSCFFISEHGLFRENRFLPYIWITSARNQFLALVDNPGTEVCNFIRMKKILLAVIFLLVSVFPVFANNYLDSLYREYYAVKSVSAKYTLLYKIISEYVTLDSENHNPDAIAGLLDKTIEELRIKKDFRRLEPFLHLKATSCYYKKKYDLASRYCDTCLQIANVFSDNNEIGDLYLTQELIYRGLHLGERGVQSLYKAIEYFRKAGNKANLANSFFTLGNIYSLTRQTDLALKAYLQSAVIYGTIKDSVSAGMAWLFCAQILMETGDLKLAEEYNQLV